MATTRRALISALTALPATSALCGLSAFANTNQTTAPPPWWLLDPISAGSSLADGWTAARLAPIVDGGAALTIQHPTQESLRIHICLHGGHPKGFAYSELFDLIVMDQGHGVREMPQDLAAVLTLLGQTICDNEVRQEFAMDDIAAMMTHTERVRAYGSGHLK